MRCTRILPTGSPRGAVLARVAADVGVAHDQCALAVHRRVDWQATTVHVLAWRHRVAPGEPYRWALIVIDNS